MRIVWLRGGYPVLFAKLIILIAGAALLPPIVLALAIAAANTSPVNAVASPAHGIPAFNHVTRSIGNVTTTVERIPAPINRASLAVAIQTTVVTMNGRTVLPVVKTI